MARLPGLLAKNLPPVELETLPRPRPLAALLGPGVIMMATSLGSGEVYFWPGLTMKYGFLFLWPALIAFSLQYVLNTEFARYTLATGETAVTGFARLWKGWAWIFLACATLPWLWPGWSTGGAEALTWVVGGDPDLVAGASLLLIGVALTGTRVVYRTVERAEKLLIGFVIVTVGVVALLAVRTPTLEAFAEGLTRVPTSLPPDLDFATLLAALAYCGAGGSVNLCTSNWARDKGFGMGARVPKVISPLTGEKASVSTEGFFFEPTKDNLERWRAWWNLIRREQSITFLGMGLVGLVLLMLISHALIHGRDLDIGMEMLRQEGLALGAGPTLAALFYLSVAVVFFTSALGVLDHVGRLVADILKVNAPAVRRSESPFLSESAIYFYVLWAMILFALGVLFIADIRDTPTLLRTAGALSGIVMFLYSTLVFVLMRRLRADVDAVSPEFGTANPFALPLWRRAALLAAMLLYGSFSVLLVLDTVKALAAS